MPDINPILAAANKAARFSDQAVTQQQDIASSQAKLWESIGLAIGQKGDSEAVVESAKTSAELRFQQAKDATAASLGTDMNQAANLLAGANEQLVAAQAKRDAALAEITKKQSVGLFDNPAEWLINQLTVNDDIARHNAANAEAENASNKITALTQATNQEVGTANLLKTSMTQAQADAQVKATKLAANVEAMKADINGYTANSQGIDAAMRASDSVAKNLHLAYSARVSEIQLSNEQARLALATEEGVRSARRLALEEENAQQRKLMQDAALEEIKNKKVSAQEQLSMVNIGRVNRGLAPLEGLSAMAFLGKHAATGSVPEEFILDYRSGTATALSGKKIVAPDPFILLKTMETSGIKWLAAQEPIRDIMQEVKRQVDNEIIAKDFAAFPAGMVTKDNVETRINKVTIGKLNDLSQNIRPGDVHNPYTIGAVADLIKLPYLKDLPLVTKVLQPIAENPQLAGTLEDPDKIIAYVQRAIHLGQLTMNEASDLSAIYRKGTLVNNETRQFTALGLPEGHGYSTRLKSVVLGTETVDIADPDSWNRYLVRLESWKYIRTPNQPGGGGVQP